MTEIEIASFIRREGILVLKKILIIPFAEKLPLKIFSGLSFDFGSLRKKVLVGLPFLCALFLEVFAMFKTSFNLFANML